MAIILSNSNVTQIQYEKKNYYNNLQIPNFFIRSGG